MSVFKKIILSYDQGMTGQQYVEYENYNRQ